MAKYVKYIFICLFAVFVMSHNTSALDYSYNVRLYDSRPIDHFYSTELQPSTSIYGAINNAQILSNLRVHFDNITVSDGLLLEIPFYVYNYNENNSVDGYMNFRGVSCQGGTIACQIAGVSYNGSGTGQMYHVYIYISGNGTLNRLNFTNSDANQYVLRQYDSERTYVPVISVFRFVDASTGGSVAPDLTTINYYIQHISAQLDNMYSRLGNIANTIPSADDIASAITEDEQEATQDAADDAATAGSTSASDATTATASLISVIGGFVNVITNAQATNCKINMNTTQLQVGEIDLCANPVPSYVQIIGSLILICAVIPLAIILFNRFISLFRSFQG